MSSPSFITECGATVLHTAVLRASSVLLLLFFPIKALCLFMLLMTIAWHRDHIQNDKVRAVFGYCVLFVFLHTQF